MPFVYLIYAAKMKGVGFALGLVNEFLRWAAKKVFRKIWVRRDYHAKSLRKVVKDDLADIPSDIEAMKPLRQGR